MLPNRSSSQVDSSGDGVWGGRSGGSALGQQLQVGGGGGPATGGAKWNNRMLLGGRERPTTSIGFNAICKRSAASGEERLHVLGAQVQGLAGGALRPSSSGRAGSVVKGITSKPWPASNASISTRTASRPTSPNNPFFMKSIDMEENDYLDLDEMNSRSPSPGGGSDWNQYSEGVEDMMNIQEGRRRSREQSITNAISFAGLGPQQPMSTDRNMRVRTGTSQQAPFDATLDSWNTDGVGSHQVDIWRRPDSSEGGNSRGAQQSAWAASSMILPNEDTEQRNKLGQGNWVPLAEDGPRPPSTFLPLQKGTPVMHGLILPSAQNDMVRLRNSKMPADEIKSYASHPDAYADWNSEAMGSERQKDFDHDFNRSMNLMSLAGSLNKLPNAMSPASPILESTAISQDVRNLSATYAEKAADIQRETYLKERSMIRTRTPQYYSEKELKESVLRKCAYTKLLSDDHLSILASECHIARFRTSDVIVREHDTQMCMYILSVGEVGEYKKFPDASKVRTVDPMLLADKRVAIYNSPLETLCILSMFLGSPAPSTFAAMSTTVMLRVPASAIQPILSNQRILVQHISAVLLSNGIVPTHSVSGGKMQVMHLANQISAFHQDFGRTHPGRSWKMTPRSRAREPRSRDKEFDIAPPDSRGHEEVQPCVGRKDGVVMLAKSQRILEHSNAIVIPENAHLSPRFLERDRFSGASATRLSFRPMAEVLKIAKERTGIPRMPPGHEDWSLQRNIVESPVVRGYNKAPAPMHTFFSSRGSTKETLAELEKAKDFYRPVQTKMGRDARKHLEMVEAIEHIKTPYQCKLSHDPRKADMIRQLQYTPELVTSPTAYMCGKDMMDKMVEERLLSTQNNDETLKPRCVSFECQTRNLFRSADMSEMIQHTQYSSKRDKEAMRKDVAAKAAMELDDERLRDKFTNAASAFPPKATPQMYRQSHYRLAQEVGMLQPHTITHPTRQLQRVTLQRERLDESSDGMSHASSVLSRTHSGAMARALSREEVLNSSIDVVRDNMNAMNGVSQTSTWNSTMRAADTTGLLPHNVPDHTNPTFACELRQMSAFEHRNGRFVTKASHAFSNIVGNDPTTETPISTIQEALAHSTAIGKQQEEGIGNEKKPFRTWMLQARYAKHDSEMFSVLHLPGEHRKRARMTDRKAWDGASATLHVPEVEEMGKPMVQDATDSRTRAATCDNRLLNPARFKPRPTWVCLERNQIHT